MFFRKNLTKKTEIKLNRRCIFFKTNSIKILLQNIFLCKFLFTTSQAIAHQEYVNVVNFMHKPNNQLYGLNTQPYIGTTNTNGFYCFYFYKFLKYG